jgi:CheY-like chemotaxis protein
MTKIQTVKGAAQEPSDPCGVPPVEVAIALVVEHDLATAQLIGAQLEVEGFKVVHAASAAAGLALAGRQPLSLIALDILLPNMGGWSFLSGLKEMPELRRVPVVIISSLAGPNMRFSLGAAAVLQKPISRHALHEALTDLRLLPLSPGCKLKVLVVDDNPKAVDLLAIYTQGLASSVLRAGGGREAIDAAVQELPDVILLDLMMPEVTGFDVVAALNEHPDTARIPIVVITAKTVTAKDRAALSRSVTAIMEKADPDPDRFRTEVRRAMSGRQVVA